MLERDQLYFTWGAAIFTKINYWRWLEVADTEWYCKWKKSATAVV